MKVGVEPLIGEKMIVTPRKTFEINYREAGSNSYYTARYPLPGGTYEVYTRKSLSSLKGFIKSKGHDFTINFERMK